MAATVGSASPAIDTLASSPNTECVVDSSSYSLSPSVSGISMVPSGTITVITTSEIASVSQTVSVTTNGGAETHSSSPFTVKVECLLSDTTFASITNQKAQMHSSSLTINAAATHPQPNC